MRLIIPSFLQRLLEVHAIDADAFEADVRQAMDGRVRTRTWAGSQQAPRHVLESLPTAFPRFKGSVEGNQLLIEAMALSNDVRILTRKTMARLQMHDTGLPETVIASLAGRPLSQFIGHDAVGPEIVIKHCIRTVDANGEPQLMLTIDVPRHEMQLTTAGRVTDKHSAANNVDVPALIARTHRPSGVCDILKPEQLSDPRGWRSIIGDDAYDIVEVSGVAATAPEPAGVSVRFVYDKQKVTAIGRGGFGAWYDRAANRWRIAGEPASLDALSAFLEGNAPVIIDGAGHVHVRGYHET